MASALVRGAMQQKAHFTLGPMTCTEALKADLQQNLHGFKFEEQTIAGVQVLVITQGGDDECFQCLCPGCAAVPYRYSVWFGVSETEVKNDTSYFNMPHHKIDEINREGGRVLGVIQAVLMKDPQTGPSPTSLGAQPLREWEITCIKTGALGINFGPEAGKWKVNEVAAVGTLAAFNSSSPESAVLKGDYIVKINGVSPSTDTFKNTADGDTLTLVIQSKREAVPGQECMV
eukprot:TRINITY_DN4637_c0_g2_i1.p1 TRINITY_DN4637_c0_g2~~TRINITY_DN4637_c0_g2_i1.p1  ORF type:complete len:250 (-),score=41.65 TRINITY_DN4637_c0_g2_i1:308-1000(-)